MSASSHQEHTPGGFRERVYELVAQIPKGRLMTYGDIAGMAGSAYASRQVGQIAHYGPPELPWQRVVNRHGGLASAYTWGGLDGHKAALEADGVAIDEMYRVVNFAELRWHPDPTTGKPQ
ncbi:MGMT family protein [Candidatus Saccharibacteria bacterium]|nr:MGMT family protein [Candidatus Saccharibacteria bacterium]